MEVRPVDCPFLFCHVMWASAVLLVFFSPAPLEGFLDAPPGLLPRACILGLLFCRDCYGGALLVFIFCARVVFDTPPLLATSRLTA